MKPGHVALIRALEYTVDRWTKIRAQETCQAMDDLYEARGGICGCELCAVALYSKEEDLCYLSDPNPDDDGMLCPLCIGSHCTPYYAWMSATENDNITKARYWSTRIITLCSNYLRNMRERFEYELREMGENIDD